MTTTKEMPIAIYYNFAQRKARCCFKGSNRFITVNEAQARGLIDDDTVRRIQEEIEVLAWGETGC